MNSHAMQNFDKTWIEAWYEEMTIYVICTDQNDCDWLPLPSWNLEPEMLEELS